MEYTNCSTCSLVDMTETCQSTRIVSCKSVYYSDLYLFILLLCLIYNTKYGYNRKISTGVIDSQLLYIIQKNIKIVLLKTMSA